MLQPAFTKALNVVLLQGHQNVGELRHSIKPDKAKICRLQGHQNVGELRLWRPAFNDSDIIAGSPECW